MTVVSDARPAEERFDVAVVGAGAAGLMAALSAARPGGAAGAGAAAKARPRIIALDSARRLGAKILIAGGGRCNVTHDEVDEGAFSGSTRPAIRKVLRRFPVAETIRFFADLGVALKREETGKLFPVTDSARTVLDALLRAVREAGVEIRHPWRVEAIEPDSGEGYRLSGPHSGMRAARVILASGGQSVPRTGSDGHGYELARRLGHTTTRLLPALVPLSLAPGCFVRGLSGIAAPVSVEVRSSTGKRIIAMTGPLLCTHFGLSGPVVLDVSRHLLQARLDDPESHLVVRWVPEIDAPPERALGPWLRARLPARLAEALLLESGVEAAARWDRLPRPARRRLTEVLTEWRAPVIGDLGFARAEVTTGGVPLSEVRLETLESRRASGLHLCGEILDVDGRIGGYNFQWAWASGFIAGSAAGGGP